MPKIWIELFSQELKGGRLVHIIAAKAICFLEAQQPEYRSYMQQVVNNARVLAEAIRLRGYRAKVGELTRTGSLCISPEWFRIPTRLVGFQSSGKNLSTTYPESLFPDNLTEDWKKSESCPSGFTCRLEKFLPPVKF